MPQGLEECSESICLELGEHFSISEARERISNILQRPISASHMPPCLLHTTEIIFGCTSCQSTTSVGRLMVLICYLLYFLLILVFSDNSLHYSVNRFNFLLSNCINLLINDTFWLIKCTLLLIHGITPLITSIARLIHVWGLGWGPGAVAPPLPRPVEVAPGPRPGTPAIN